MVHAPPGSGCVVSEGIPRPHGIGAKSMARSISFTSVPRLLDDIRIAWGGSRRRGRNGVDAVERRGRKGG